MGTSKQSAGKPAVDPESWSHCRKLARAEHHICDVEAAVARWRKDGYRTYLERESDGRVVPYAQLLKPLPDNLPLVVGDAIQCMRHSLDHIIFALSKKNPGMTANDEDKPQFPISDKAITDKHPRISFLEPTARKDVCDLAPDPTRQPLNEDPLWLLNKTSNRDKHREIAVTVAAAAIGGASAYGDVIGDVAWKFFDPQPLEAGEEPVALGWIDIPDFTGKVRTATLVVFGKGIEVADRPVLATLPWFHKHIRDTVFQRLEAHL